MMNRVICAIAWGCAGMIVGCYAVGFIVYAILSIQSEYDPSAGMAIGLIAIPIGAPLGFTFGAIFGFRDRQPEKPD
jgi:hypothetical protein